MFSKSSASSQKKAIWYENLRHFQKAVNGRQFQLLGSLIELCEMPTEQMILNRFKSLGSEEKSTQKRIKVISHECEKLWQKFDFPIINAQSVSRKIEKLIKRQEHERKRAGKFDFSLLFDVTDSNGTWLQKDDYEFYNMQTKSKCKVGYCTNKIDNVKKFTHQNELLYSLKMKTALQFCLMQTMTVQAKKVQRI